MARIKQLNKVWAETSTITPETTPMQQLIPPGFVSPLHEVYIDSYIRDNLAELTTTSPIPSVEEVNMQLLTLDAEDLDTLSQQTIHIVTDNHLPSLEDIGEDMEQDGLLFNVCEEQPYAVEEPLHTARVPAITWVDRKCE